MAQVPDPKVEMVLPKDVADRLVASDEERAEKAGLRIAAREERQRTLGGFRPDELCRRRSRLTQPMLKMVRGYASPSR